MKLTLLVASLFAFIFATKSSRKKLEDLYDEKGRRFLDTSDGPDHDAVTGDYKIKPTKGFPDEPDNTLAYSCKRVDYVHPDLFLEIPDIITKYNYDLETQKTKTEDGYILTLFRIKGSPISPARKGKKAVYLNHGLMGNAISWLFLYGNNSLAFKLANAGYDVFLGNARGNFYSQGHENLSTTTDKYWDFSFHELGYYDVPAVIDHILNVTGQEDIYYVGHSLGTMQYMIAMSERPEYAYKIRVGFLLSPAGFVDHLTSPGLLLLFNLVPPTQAGWKALFGNYLNKEGLIKVVESSCLLLSIACGSCDNVAFYLNGYNPKQNNISVASFFGKRYYDISSTKIFAHIGQSVRYKTFRQYDYKSIEKNMKAYGADTPPDYKLDRIRANTVAFWGYSDVVTVPVDVKKTLRAIPPKYLKENNRVNLESFGHLDMLIANDVQKHVYNRIQYIMDEGLYVQKKPPRTSNKVLRF